jgi:carboxyl-terminal processing protease
MARGLLAFVLGLLVCFSRAGMGRAAEDQPPSPSEEKPQAAAEPGAADAPEEVKASPEEQYFELMRIFADSFEQVEKNYVKQVDRRRLIDAALRGMMKELDPFSNYIGPEDLTHFRDEVEKEFGGIGIQVREVNVSPQTKRLLVTSPLPGTPAHKAGVRAGDLIMEINGKSTENMTMDEAVKLLRGPAGDEVSISVVHQGTTEVVKLAMRRALIEVPTVQGDGYKADETWNFMLDAEKRIAYVRITGFSKHTGSEMKRAMQELKAQDLKGLILDLRFNPGGLFNVAVEVADLFLEEGRIVSTKGRNTEERVSFARKAGTYSGFPMAVLVNRYSASASEIVSAALQDHKRAVVVGERTFGKGSVQNVIDLEGGKSAIKLTTQSYHRPNGKNIHRFPDSKETDDWGVVPDEGYQVPFSNAEMLQYEEYRRLRDVLNKDGPPKSDFVDRQLAKALEYLSNKLAEPEAASATTPAGGQKEPERSANNPAEPAEKAKPAGQPSARNPLREPAAGGTARLVAA